MSVLCPAMGWWPASLLHLHGACYCGETSPCLYQKVIYIEENRVGQESKERGEWTEHHRSPDEALMSMRTTGEDVAYLTVY